MRVWCRVPLSHLLQQLRAFPSLCAWVAGSALSSGDVGGPDSWGRALPAPRQSLVFLLWLLCHGKFNYNPFRRILLTYLACSPMLVSCWLAASLPGTSCCRSCRRVKSSLGPWDEETRVPMLAGDPVVSTGLESGTPSQARQHEGQLGSSFRGAEVLPEGRRRRKHPRYWRGQQSGLIHLSPPTGDAGVGTAQPPPWLPSR